MSSRYPTTKVFDYCLHPVHIKDEFRDVFVPCGVCNGCLLHNANEWSMRVGTEIESSKSSIFFTLTYSNDYLPILKREYPVFDGHSCYWTADNFYNIRKAVKSFSIDSHDICHFEFVEKRRKDIVTISSVYPSVPVRNWIFPFEVIPYVSKRDIQLWLKSIRVILDNRFKNEKFRSFRYYLISEYGPTPPTHRPHYHGVLFFDSQEVAQYALEQLLYPCWSMCDKSRFDPFAHFVDSGVRGYVTEYLTMSAHYPQVYTQEKSVRVFRLASKSKPIGLSHLCEEDLFEKVISGTIEYSRSIKRLGTKSTLRFPAASIRSLFPKISGYGEKSFEELYRIYSVVYSFFGRFNNSECRYRLDGFLFDFCGLHQQDVYVILHAFRVCRKFNWSLYTYLYALDMAYYLSDMFALRLWYQWQEIKAKDSSYYDILSTYNNLGEFVAKYSNTSDCCTDSPLYYFSVGFGFKPSELIFKQLSFSSLNDSYIAELSDIMDGMYKKSKVREFMGISPNNV